MPCMSSLVSEGVKAFKKTVDYCNEKGLVVIGDVKRGDIGSTSAGLRGRTSGKSKSRIQAVMQDLMRISLRSIRISDLTASNRLSRSAKKRTKDLFILVKTSNPSSGEFQDRLIDGRPLYELGRRDR